MPRLSPAVGTRCRCTRAYAQTAFADAVNKLPAQNPVVAAQAVPSPTDDTLPQVKTHALASHADCHA